MTIDVKRNADNVIVYLEGWLNVESCEDFDRHTENLVAEKKVTIDMAGVEYMSSAGLRRIVAFYKELSANQGELCVINAAPAVMEVFRLTGINKRINVTEKA